MGTIDLDFRASDPCQAQADVLELVIQRCIQGGSKLLAVLLSSQIS